MADYGLIKSFGIDDGQLDGLTPQECFVLGYELADVDALLSQKEAISRPVHAENRDRLEKSCRDSGRQFQLVWNQDDVSEAWLQLDVAPDEA